MKCNLSGTKVVLGFLHANITVQLKYLALSSSSPARFIQVR